jgi:hypothetical protein
MAPVKGPFVSAMMMMMVVVMVIHSTGLCGCNWQSKGNAGKRS